MFGRSYQLLPQRDSSSQKTPGLFVNSHSFSQPSYHKGLSFDYIPNISANDFTDASQGWVSWICNLIVIFLVYICTFIAFPVTGWFVLKTVPNYQRVVVFRLGRVCPPKGPGVVLVLPLIDQWQRVDLRTRAFNVPPCQVITRDGGVLLVGADIQFRIWNPVMSVVSVQDLNASTRMTAQNALTHSLSKKTIREIQTERLKLEEYLGVSSNMSRLLYFTGCLIFSANIISMTLKLVCFLVCVHVSGSGAAGSGSLCGEPDVTLSMSDCDLVDMFQGRLRPFAAYTSGKLKVQGDVKTAMKLEELIKQLKK
uniref:Stomatin (EPB72)-like 1 n=1 Tax=Poecilia reticulata TaxID=8081 RepID=A0A3P9NYR0_POERE